MTHQPNGAVRYPLDKWGIPKHPAFTKSRFQPTRRRMMLWLASQGGAVEMCRGVNTKGNWPGISPQWLIEEAGLEGSSTTSLPGMLKKMAEDGLIVRTGNAKQTHRIELVPEWNDKLADQRLKNGHDPIEQLPETATETNNEPEDLAEAPTPQQDEAASEDQTPTVGWPEEAASVAPDLSGFGFSDDQINHIARRLLEQAVDAIVTNREAAAPNASLVEALERRLADALEDNGRLRTRLGESRDHNRALAQQLDLIRKERNAAQDQVHALTRQIRKLPPPADETFRRELDRLMREIPRVRG